MQLVLFTTDSETSEIRTVISTVNKDYLPDDKLNDGYIFEESDIPPAENRPGYNPIQKININTLEISYEYVARQLTLEERIEKLETESTELRQILITNDLI